MTAVGEPLPAALVLRDVEVEGVRGDVRVRDGRIVEVGPAVRPDRDDEQVVEGGGGALLPGLHDHHIHLRGLAAALTSVACGPPDVVDVDQLRTTLRTATAREGWIRGVGYHTSVAGELDRAALDDLRADVAVRVQDRSGVVWYVNSAAVRALGLADDDHPGIERDPAGHPTGRLIRADDLLAQRAPTVSAPLDEVGALLAERGVTGCTDATVTNDVQALADLAAAQDGGALPQTLRVLGRHVLAETAEQHRPRERLRVGQVKLVLDEHDLPALSDVVAAIESAHQQQRGVAVHAVTRATLALTVAALRQAGTIAADRVEHASVCPPELGQQLAAFGVTVVTQPGLVAERGERYRAEVDPDDQPWLYPLGGLLAWGVRVAASTDAPFGTPDPWAAIRAAVDRRTGDGAALGPQHAVTAQRALDAFLGPLDDPGAPPRRIEVGAPADLCLLDRPLADALRACSSGAVRCVIVGGRMVRRDA